MYCLFSFFLSWSFMKVKLQKFFSKNACKHLHEAPQRGVFTGYWDAPTHTHTHRNSSHVSSYERESDDRLILLLVGGRFQADSDNQEELQQTGCKEKRRSLSNTCPPVCCPDTSVPASRGCLNPNGQVFLFFSVFLFLFYLKNQMNHVWWIKCIYNLF